MGTRKIPLNTLLISLGLVIGTEWGKEVVISKGFYDPLMVLGVTRILQALLIVLVVLAFQGHAASIGLRRSRMFPGLLRGFLWSAAFGAATFIVFLLVNAFGVNPLKLIRMPLPATTTETISFFIVGGLIGPVAEEMFFRGLIFGFLRRWGTVVAVLVSTAIFVACHPSFPGLAWPQIVGGLLFAVAYEVEKSLITPITIHSLGNTAIFGLSLVLGAGG
jgi:hypothetical protein